MDKPKELNIASDPVVDNKLPHLKIDIRDSYPETFFLPGDPERIKLFKKQADEFKIISNNREFIVAVGSYQGCPFGVASTGIGGGSTEIVVVELSRCGVKNLIRVGGCGALQEEIKCGSFVINSGTIRMGGASKNYVAPEFPAVADPFICTHLAQTASELGQAYHVGIGATVDSYYEGQYRVSSKNRNLDFSKEMEIFHRNNVLNFDMETETIFTLSYLFKMKAGSILGVHGNRVSNLWLTEYLPTQEKVVSIALNTLKKLNQLGEHTVPHIT